MKNILTFLFSFSLIITYAQYGTYNTYSDPYGNTTGYGTQTTDWQGNNVTNYSDQYGNSQGSAKTTTDWQGNKIITYYDNYGNVIGTKKIPD